MLKLDTIERLLLLAIVALVSFIVTTLANAAPAKADWVFNVWSGSIVGDLGVRQRFIAAKAKPKRWGGKISSGAKKSVSGRGSKNHARVITRTGADSKCFPRRLRAILKKTAKHYGRDIIVQSGYRSRRYNRRVGGVRRSQHIRCMAADVWIAGVNKYRLARYVKRNHGGGGVGTYCGSRSIHVDIGPKRRWHWPCHTKRRFKRRTKRG